MRAALLLVLAGIAFFTSGCCDQLCVARTAVNAERDYLAFLHEDMKARYRAEQIAAVQSVPGDPQDEAVKQKRREAVAKVRDKWRPTWTAYGLAHAAWIACDKILREQEIAWLDGKPPDQSAVNEAIWMLAQAIADAIAAETQRGG